MVCGLRFKTAIDIRWLSRGQVISTITAHYSNLMWYFASTPQQYNGYDCGLFTRFLQYIKSMQERTIANDSKQWLDLRKNVLLSACVTWRNSKRN